MSYKIKEKRICKNCGHAFLFYIYSSNKGIYCSRKCAAARMSERIKKLWAEGIIKRRIWPSRNNNGFILVDNCSTCGEEYRPDEQIGAFCETICEKCHNQAKFETL